MFSELRRVVKRLFLEDNVTTIVTIRVDGQERKVDLGSGITDELIARLANELKLAAPQVAALLTAANFQRTDVVDTTTVNQGSTGAMKQAATRPLKRIVCPQCKHTIAEAGWCIYCGYRFTATEERKPVRDEVDQKALETDVGREAQVEEKKVQRVQDSYQDRLKGI